MQRFSLSLHQTSLSATQPSPSKPTPPYHSNLYTTETVMITLTIQAYGVEFVSTGAIPYNPPLQESTPRIPSPYASNIFYYAQYDALSALSASKPWSFCEIRPDAIIGFAPNNNFMNLAQGLGLFLAMYRSFEGEGAEVPFPGDEKAWRHRHTDTSQDVLARFHIHAALHPEEVEGKAFNVGDEDGAVIWADGVWDGVCSFFHLKGVGPEKKEKGDKPTGVDWMNAQKPKWAQWVKDNGLKEGALEGTSWEFFAALFSIPFDREYDLTASRSVGFKDSVNTAAGYHIAFERMRQANIIP